MGPLWLSSSLIPHAPLHPLVVSIPRDVRILLGARIPQGLPAAAPRRFAIGDPLPVVAHHPGNLWETLTDHQSRVVGVEALILGVTGLSPHRVVAVLTRAVLLAHLLTLAQAILRAQDRVHGHVQGH
ncbi:hypothetical protein RSOL_416540 [Rhizoctonia solani AG-3 Rhs1AP]|uniref:Uncharacterized protein n=1 Tax=Rhizoctonia solani AG-3 Rhs1AP TaxID=1086054 RepID=X8JGB0_9AGAM|nr:hypothetical protein RSOL_416540 [Rhizoctonia solani AG-3 Rhs1AP]